MKKVFFVIAGLVGLAILIKGVDIMAHKKVYGSCENLCKVEVVAKENIAVVDFDITIPAGQTSGDTWIEYPEGFNVDNSVVISIMEGNSEYGLESRYDLMDVGLFNDEMWITRKTWQGEPAELSFLVHGKIVLYKYRDDV